VIPSDPRLGGRTVHHRRPGAGQSSARAYRGWHPDTIVAPYLVPDERVLLEETRSVRAFFAARVPLLVGVGILLVIVASFGEPVPLLMAFVGASVLAVKLAVDALQAWFTRYVVTDLRVLRVSGVLNRHAEFIPWGKVTDVTRSETLLQWLARTASIRIESANEASGFRTIDEVDDPDRFYRVLVRMVDRKQGRIADPTSAN
jgi:hypothetical protein